MNKKLLITLGVSLALNFLFIGFEASRLYYQPCGCGCKHGRHIPPARPEFMPHKMHDGFGLPEQQMIKKTFKDAFKNHGKEMKKAMEDVKEALKKEPFDAEQFKEALQKAAEVRSTIDTAVQENMVEMISKMSPEEREHFAKQFNHKDKAFKHKKGIHKKNGGKHKEAHLPPPPPPEEGDED